MDTYSGRQEETLEGVIVSDSKDQPGELCMCVRYVLGDIKPEDIHVAEGSMFVSVVASMTGDLPGAIGHFYANLENTGQTERFDAEAEAEYTRVKDDPGATAEVRADMAARIAKRMGAVGVSLRGATPAEAAKRLAEAIGMVAGREVQPELDDDGRPAEAYPGQNKLYL